MDENAVAASKKNASRRNGAIFFEDEVGFSQQGTTIRTWAPRGEGAIIDSAPGRSCFITRSGTPLPRALASSISCAAAKATNTPGVRSTDATWRAP